MILGFLHIFQPWTAMKTCETKEEQCSWSDFHALLLETNSRQQWSKRKFSQRVCILQKYEIECQLSEAKAAGNCRIDWQRMRQGQRRFRNCMGVTLSLLLSLGLQLLHRSPCGQSRIARERYKPNSHSLSRPADEARRRKLDWRPLAEYRLWE